MIARDEEGTLARALESVVGIADEAIIVDTGSTDRTKQIAASFAAKFPGVPDSTGQRRPGLTLLDFEWCDDFSAARNVAIDHASADWILHLDADEELIVDPGGLGLEDCDTLMGLFVSVYTAANRDDLANATEHTVALRLFRNVTSNRFERRVRESVPRQPGAEYSSSSASFVLHFGPSARPTETSMAHRERDVHLLGLALADDPADGAAHMHLAIGLMQQHEWDSALRSFQDALQNLPQTSEFIAPIFRDTVSCLMSSERFDDAIAVQEAAEIDFPDYTDLVFLRATMAERLLGPERATMAYRRCLAMGDPPKRYPTWGGTGSTRAIEALGRLGAS